jgi:lysophospholipase L1-like esterase
LGNSITFAGGYIDYVEVFIRTRYPEKSITLVNRGMPSETLAGTSEETHIPRRPYLFNRLGEVFTEVGPDFVFVCYGMNDGIYQPFQEALFKDFRQGVHQLEEKLRERNLQNYAFLTPPPFEYRYFSHLPDTFSVFDYRNPSPDYNQTLRRYSNWLNRSTPNRTLRIHEPLQAMLEEVQSRDSSFTLTVDGIHPNATGHWLMADQIIQQLNLLEPHPEIAVDFGSNSFQFPVIDAELSDAGVRIEAILHQLVPFDTAWNPTALQASGYYARYNNVSLQVQNIRTGNYAVTIADDTLDRVSSESLNRGVKINLSEANALQRRARRLLRLIQDKRELERNLWVLSSGHYRFESMKHELAERETLSRVGIDSLNSEILSLAEPDTFRITISPVKES